MLTSRYADSVSWFADQATLALRWMSPLPGTALLSVAISTLPPASAVCSVLAPMPLLVLAPDPALMVKSVGSISQVPDFPLGASVVTLTLSWMMTWEADVSMNPPSPPKSPPLADSVPLMSALLLGLLKSAMAVMVPPWPLLFGAASASRAPVLTMRWLADRRMTPPLSTRPEACRVPLFLTTPLCSWLAAWADKIIRPPGACTAWPFSIKASTVAGLTKMLVKRFCLSNSIS